MKPSLLLSSFVALAVALVACRRDVTAPPTEAATVTLGPADAQAAAASDASADASASSSSSSSSEPQQQPPALDSGTAAAGDFYACTSDSDCIAVPRVGCCHNGYKEAVNKQSADAYKLSFVCPTPNQMCPQFLVNDTRVPECSYVTSKCEMVPIDKIECGAFRKNPHACPNEYRCVKGKPADLPGKCIK